MRRRQNPSDDRYGPRARKTTMGAMTTPVLERAIQACGQATAKPTFVSDLPVAEEHKTVRAGHDGQFPGPAADKARLSMAEGPTERGGTDYTPRDTHAAEVTTAHGGDFQKALPWTH